ncbi:HSP90 [Yam asymptomatic virus 1]|uniref:HSP90 n=1 Tax=Yam asymptomatic virus 1 TaxID=2771210 RepID=A0A7H1JMH7_9CLOS|nr:HSP90 [Yam asymptomatic virus 1]QNT12724.1 HSP90 [Yam asymptomatic virus 1]
MSISDVDTQLLRCVFGRENVEDELIEYSRVFANKRAPLDYRWSEYFLYDYLKSKGMLENYQGTEGEFRRRSTLIVQNNYYYITSRNYADLSTVKGGLIGPSSEEISEHAKKYSGNNPYLRGIIVACCESAGRLVSLGEIRDAYNLSEKVVLRKPSDATLDGISKRCKRATDLYLINLLRLGDPTHSTKVIIYADMIRTTIDLTLPFQKKPEFIGLKAFLIELCEKFRPKYDTFDNRTFWLESIINAAESTMRLLYGKFNKPTLDSLISLTPFRKGDDVPVSERVLTNRILLSGLIGREKGVRMFLPERVFVEVLQVVMNEFRHSCRPLPTPKRCLSILLLYGILQRTNKTRLVAYQKKFSVTFGTVTYTCDIHHVLTVCSKFDKDFGNTFRRFLGTFSALASKLSTNKSLTAGNIIWKDFYDLPLSLNFDFAKYLNPKILSKDENHYLTALNYRFSKIK